MVEAKMKLVNVKTISWLMVLLWMTVIFIFSSRPASISADESSAVTEVIQKVADEAHEIGIVKRRIVVSDNFTRKAAHVTEYFILTLLLANALRTTRTKLIILWALSFSLVYACLDELHQAVVPGRGALFRDVLIDSIGIFAGIAVMTVMMQVKLLKKV